MQRTFVYALLSRSVVFRNSTFAGSLLHFITGNEFAVRRSAVGSLCDRSPRSTLVNMVLLQYQTLLLPPCPVWAIISLSTLDAIKAGELQVLQVGVYILSHQLLLFRTAHSFCIDGTVISSFWSTEHCVMLLKNMRHMY